MHEEKNADKERRPEYIKQQRACARLKELTQDREIPIDIRCTPRICANGIVEAYGEHFRTEAIFKPGSKPAQNGATQCVKHAPDRDGKRNNQGEHQKRVGASTRRDAVINLKQVDGG